MIPAHIYDQLVENERLQDKRRALTELAVAQERSNLLVPLQQRVRIPVQTRTVTTTKQN